MQNPLPILFLTDQRIDMRNERNALLLLFEECRSDGFRGKTLKLLGQVPMILALDVFDDSEGDRKVRSDSAVKTVPLTVLVLTVQKNIENGLFSVALVIAFW